jgi:long-chain acyl-CoA synthetase
MQVTRLFDLLPNQLENFPKPDALSGKVNGSWIKYSTQQFKEYAEYFSYGLIASGLNKGDKIGIIANNRPEWNFADIGALQTGIIDVPVYPTISETDLKYILNHGEVKMVFVSTAELYHKVNSLAKEIPSIKAVYTFNDVPGAKNWKEIVELGKNNPAPEKLEEIKKAILPDDLATLIYTSGTTGVPKGVMLSHNNILKNCEAT